MTDAELLKWAQSCPPEIMREMSRTACRAVTHHIIETVRGAAAAMDALEAQSGKRAKPSEIAEGLCAAILSANEKTWGVAGRA